ncbi:hypothetical protein PG994_006304 [Apiospora phragmitis]|uniref:Uncharacterized protein n=1 Tax=Apiospora phragmitis TaxID=2905665 RepID=A0ABR1VEN4_9PEZI
MIAAGQQSLLQASMQRWLRIQGKLGRAAYQTRRGLNPLMIYLPPFWDGDSEHLSQVPAFCRKYLTAVINYRWAGFGSVSDWILEHLAPLNSARRDIYVFGSYLGASLAASLALTETHPHERTAIRGFAAYNGIYNWTMFLPDHPIHKLPKNRPVNILEEILGQPTDPGFQEMKYNAETLFANPTGLFDPFASPCLFFHTPGLLVPPDFHSTAETRSSLLGSSEGLTDDQKFEAIMGAIMGGPEQAPRRSPLVFPPRTSTLKIPECLILHSKAQMPVVPHRRGSRRLKKIPVSNHFRTQAHELATVMRRSLQKVEFKERMKWDDSFGGFGDDMDRRVGLRDVGFVRSAFEMPAVAQAAIGDWLEDRATIHPRSQVSHHFDPEHFWGNY